MVTEEENSLTASFSSLLSVDSTTTTTSRPWVIQKYGGTSIGKYPDKIACDIVSQYNKENRIAIVCSARSTDTKAQGTTTRLLKAAESVLHKQEDVNGNASGNENGYIEIVDLILKDHLEAAEKYIKQEDIRLQLGIDMTRETYQLQELLHACKIINEISPRTRDSIMGAGERLSCMFMSAFLNSIGVPAQYIDLEAVIPINYKPTKKNAATGLNQEFYNYVAKEIGKRLKECGDNKVPVVTGFFGYVPGGLLNSVGRGYTDLCAALAAVGVDANELQIWKEVDGIFTADPRKVPTARLVSMITPEEAAELTYYGSEVIHPFTMEQVIRARIPIRIKNVENPIGQGTVIFPDNDSRRGDETPPHPPLARNDKSFLTTPPTTTHHILRKVPTAVTTKDGIVVLSVHSNRRQLSHGFLAGIFSILDDERLVVDLISTSQVHVSLALEVDRSSSRLKQAIIGLEKYGSVDILYQMSIVSMVGKEMKAFIGVAGKMFTTLANAGINIEMISQGSNEINISCVIQTCDSLKALNVLHQNMLSQPVNILADRSAHLFD